jgi:hypothetical protein
MSPIAQEPKAQGQAQHVVINLDAELVLQALVESLNLLESLQTQRSQDQTVSTICSQLRVRISYAVLHSEAPEFKAASLRTLALYHSRSATSLLRAQRQLHQLHQS